MKRVSLSAGIMVFGLLAALASMPAHAATSQQAPPMPASIAQDHAQTETAAMPYTIRIGKAECPVVPKGSSMSPNAQRLLEILTEACLMKASGMITDFQFESMRDQAVMILNTQLSEMSDAAARPPQPLASNP